MTKLGKVTAVWLSVAAAMCGPAAWAATPATPATPDGAPDYVLEAMQTHASRDLAILHTDLFPGLLLRVKGDSLCLFRDLGKVGLEGPRYAAFVAGGGVKVVSRADAAVEIANALEESWMLVWFADGKGWDGCRFMKDGRAGKFFQPEVPPIDVPFLVVFQHRPAKVTLSAEGLTASGVGPLEQVVLLPLYGSAKPSPQVTARWAKGLPAEIVKQCRFWAGVARSVPVYCREDY